MTTNLADKTHVEIPNDDFILAIRGCLSNDISPRTDEVRRSVVVRILEILCAHPVDGTDVVLVGYGRRRLLQLPQILRMSPRRRCRVENDLCSGEAERPPSLGEVSVITDIHADSTNGRIENGIAEIARLEVELLPEPFDLRNVHLAVDPEKFSIVVDDSRSVVEGSFVDTFVDGHDQHHPRFPGESDHPLNGRAVRDLLGLVVVAWILNRAEVRRVEYLLKTQDLRPLIGGLPRVLDILFDHGLPVTGPLRLHQGCTHDFAHGSTPLILTDG